MAFGISWRPPTANALYTYACSGQTFGKTIQVKSLEGDRYAYAEKRDGIEAGEILVEKPREWFLYSLFAKAGAADGTEKRIIPLNGPFSAVKAELGKERVVHYEVVSRLNADNELWAARIKAEKVGQFASKYRGAQAGYLITESHSSRDKKVDVRAFFTAGDIFPVFYSVRDSAAHLESCSLKK